MSERILFITGKLAEKSLRRTLEGLNERTFDYEIRVLGVAIAALLTADMIKRRLADADGFDRVLLPGRCRGDTQALTAHFGVPFERGPEELKDLPRYFGMQGAMRELDRSDMLIFAELVDAPLGTIDDALARAAQYRADGADVIDIGCLPDTPFPHLEDLVGALKAAGYRVSVDSLVDEDLLRGGRAGADYLFSLSAKSLWIADEVPAIPILIGDEPTRLESLFATVDQFLTRDRPFYADAILDPIHYGFSESIVRYHALRARYPAIDIMMGIGNLSELTHADTLGINSLLLGLASELNVTGLLTTEVSGHCRSVVREIDLARRVMFAAREDSSPPRHIDEGLLALHERHPFPYDDTEIREFAGAVRDPNFRIQVSASGISIYNRDGLNVATDPYELFPRLAVEDDGSHAFYLGLELARAQIAWQLGKRYEQDEELKWGVVVPRAADDKQHFAAERSTLQARKRRRKSPPG
jgi:dihydropteroate synthase-like protein